VAGTSTGCDAGGADRGAACGGEDDDALNTTAGAILTFVFLSFSVSDETQVPMIGIGLATAWLDDMTVLPLFLAPALLELGGERAWWMLSWLS